MANTMGIEGLLRRPRRAELRPHSLAPPRRRVPVRLRPIELDGDDLPREPFETRKATLASVLAQAAPGLRLNEHVEADGPIAVASLWLHADTGPEGGGERWRGVGAGGTRRCGVVAAHVLRSITAGLRAHHMGHGGRRSWGPSCLGIKIERQHRRQIRHRIRRRYAGEAGPKAAASFFLYAPSGWRWKLDEMPRYGTSATDQIAQKDQ